MLEAFFQQHGWERTYWIAYSGGVDSHALLSMCHQLQKNYPLKLRAIHVNHQLSQNANSWAQHCEKICKNYNIDLVQCVIQLDLKSGESVEAIAREKRYAIFAEYVQAGDMVLTAHHQDDQAETLLLQLLRGAGPKGLAAMPALKPLAKGFLARPLLTYSRTHLEEYAQKHQLQWIEDESNQNQRLTRNAIRHELFPAIIQRWPAAKKAFARSATHCAESQVLLEEFAHELLKDLQGTQPRTLSVNKILQLTPARQRLVLRTWIHQQGFSLPDTKKIEAIIKEVLLAAPDAMPLLKWSEVSLRRYQDDLYLLEEVEDHDSFLKIEWDLKKPLALPSIGVLSAQASDKGLRIDILSVTVSFRQGGEVINLPGRGRHTLKNLFQEWCVPPWERERIPLLFVGEECISVVGYCVAVGYEGEPGNSVVIVITSSRLDVADNL